MTGVTKYENRETTIRLAHWIRPRAEDRSGNREAILSPRAGCRRREASSRSCRPTSPPCRRCRRRGAAGDYFPPSMPFRMVAVFAAAAWLIVVISPHDLLAPIQATRI